MRPRHSLQDRFQLAFSDWNDAIAGMRDADFEQMVYPQWDLKDILGHVFAYLELHLHHIQSYMQRKRLASPRAPSYSDFNRRERDRLRPVPVAQLRRDMDAAYREIRALLPSLSAGDLKKKFPAQWTNSTYRTKLRYQLRSMAEHLEIHAREVKKWRTRSKI